MSDNSDYATQFHPENIVQISWQNAYYLSNKVAYIVPEVVGTIGMSSASVGIDQGMRNCGAKSLIIIFLQTKKFNISDKIMRTIHSQFTKHYANTNCSKINAKIVTLKRTRGMKNQ